MHRATLERLVAEGVTSRSPHFKRLYNTYTLQEARVLEDRRKAILAEREAQKAAAAKKAKPAAKKQKPAVSKPKAKPTTKKPPKAASSGAPGIGRPSASDPDSVTKWIESGRPVSVRRDRLAYARRHGLKHRIPE
ncbi:MAG: hypothetical protein NDJ92_18335 [Thermoanaerobaculia bacterium]|nr:hypothetical protein [Thermoanaerobaculia bacterium]